MRQEPDFLVAGRAVMYCLLHTTVASGDYATRTIATMLLVGLTDAWIL
ncbi:TPA: hypothetical protein RVT57_005162 [Escherichia coli]|nr:hypothetical protein [Escherichia coli]